ERALEMARQESERPSLVICRTTIGYGCPNKAGTAASHGEPLGGEEVCRARENLSWPYEEPFTVPEPVLTHMRQAREQGGRRQQAWQAKFEDYHRKFPEAAKELVGFLSGELPQGWDKGLSDLFSAADKPMATREASGRVLNTVAPRVGNLVGGSADLAPSTKTLLKDYADYGPADYQGRNLRFGIREHAMGAVANGMALHGGLIPYTGTFLIFYDYMRPPVRLAALMGIRVIYVFSHDSVGLGEDGPTHQPVEQLMGLRTVPGLVTIRPADAAETAVAWQVALERPGPTALVLSRQKLAVLDRTALAPASGVVRGGYILWSSDGEPEVIIIATGSEVHIGLEAAGLLKDKGIGVRLVSMPSWELFEAQPSAYRNQVLSPDRRCRVSIEAGITLGWERYLGCDGIAIGISRFGASAPGKTVYEKFGLTAQHVVEAALKLVQR
ncbi:MAG: transketolase, partial [Dehalococcoidales bacterium]|nr:transketolase [Dehalococcoidales bacterium]